MRSIILCGLAVAVTVGITPVGVGAQPAPASAPSTAPEGYLLVEEEVWFVVDDESEEHFHRAHDSFVKKDLKKAAAQIRKGEAFLKLEAGRATAEGKKLMEESGHELAKLADDVERGTITSVKRLDEAFARAHQALAVHHHLKAKDSWASKAEQAAHKVGQDLKAAAEHAHQGLVWTGQKAEAAGAKAMKDTRLLAGKLIEGAGWVPAEVGKGLEAVGAEIEKLGKKVAPAKAS
ncbi:MAG: hypothetical protein LKG23_15325 [Nitrospira sp.]|nr:hypothetical protein [Nitrospira sp.]